MEALKKRGLSKKIQKICFFIPPELSSPDYFQILPEDMLWRNLPAFSSDSAWNISVSCQNDRILLVLRDPGGLYLCFPLPW
jgi:hypothetical protein